MVIKTYKSLENFFDNIKDNQLNKGVIKVEGWFVDRYQIIEIIGVGSSSIVFKAFDNILERIVALKIWHSVYFLGSIILKECKFLAKSKHKNIVQVFDYDFDTITNRPWASLEYLGRYTLRDVINNNIKLKNDIYITIALQILYILNYLNNKLNLYQLDIKPENFAFNKKTGIIKLMDLGSANQNIFKYKRGLGTPGYIAPELFESNKINEKIDIFSSGMVLFELVTGNNPLTKLEINLIDSISFESQMYQTSIFIPFSDIPKKEDIYKGISCIDFKKIISKYDIPKDLIKLILSMCSVKPSKRPEIYNAINQIKSISTNKSINLPTIFISHSHLDKQRFVHKFANILKKKGFNVWLDEWDIKIGEPFWDRIFKAIEKSDYVIVVISKNSIHSNGVSEELRSAHLENIKKIKILPIRIDPIQYSDIPLFIRSRQISDFVGWENRSYFNKKINKLIADIISLSN